jgi:hypothetical protein
VSTPADARAGSPDCQEVADAEYNGAYFLQASCQDDLAKGRRVLNFAEATERMELAYFISETSLQQSFRQFWVSCKDFWSDDKAQFIWDTYINALKKQMPSKWPVQVSPRALQAGSKRVR